MLPARHRMRRSEDFSLAVRSGSRSGGPHLVVHLLTSSTPDVDDDPRATRPTPALAARVGLVVSKAVGNAVQRNLVKRRLRELMSARVTTLPDGVLVVVRALPAARDASYAELRDGLDRSLHGATRRAQRDSGRTAPTAAREG